MKITKQLTWTILKRLANTFGIEQELCFHYTYEAPMLVVYTIVNTNVFLFFITLACAIYSHPSVAVN